jgi:hypothetical protein
MYTGLLGPGEMTEIEGDGLVPCASSRLEGAIEVCLDDAVHGQLAGSPWYGSEGPLDVWWPIAVDAWRSALRARLDSSSVPGRDQRPADADSPGTSQSAADPGSPDAAPAGPGPRSRSSGGSDGSFQRTYG